MKDYFIQIVDDLILKAGRLEIIYIVVIVKNDETTKTRASLFFTAGVK